MSERVSLPRNVAEGLRQPAHQAVYTYAAPFFRVACTCGEYTRETRNGWSAVSNLYGLHLTASATRDNGGKA